MRKLTLLALVMMLLGIFTLMPLAAQEAIPNVFTPAELVPATSQAYVALRLDDAHIATLNELFVLITAALKDMGVPVDGLPRLQDVLAQAIDPSATPADVDSVLGWMGDTIAMSGEFPASGEDMFTIYLPINDRQAALEALNRANLSLVESGTSGRFTLYQTQGSGPTALLVADDLMILTSVNPELLASGDYAKLSTREDFTKTVSDLPADTYNIAFFIDDSLITENQQPGMASLTGDIMMAGTILDGKTLTFDAVALPPTPAQPAAVIDPAFQSYIPANSTLVVHASDLSNLLNSAIALGEAQGNTTARAEFDQALQAAGLSLEDLLSWTTGDYAAFGRVDTAGLIRAFADANGEAVASSFDFGVVVEAADPALAQKFADKLTEILSNAIAGQPDTTITTVDINGTPVTRIESTSPTGLSSAPVNFALGMAANDKVFVFGTFRAVESVLMGGAGLGENALYTESSAYLLPNATSIWYADGSSLAALGVGGLAGIPMGPMLAPQEFNFGRETASTAQAQTIQNGDDTALILNIVERLTRLVRHVTVSTAIGANGTYVLRATLTLGE